MDVVVNRDSRIQRGEVLSQLLALRHTEGAVFLWENRKALREIFQEAAERESSALRNVFGDGSLLLGLQTVRHASEEIGIGGKILMVGLLLPFSMDDEIVSSVEKNFGTDSARALKAAAEILKLSRKTHLLKTENFRNLLLSKAEDIRVMLLLISYNAITMRRIKPDGKNKEPEHCSFARQQISAEAAYIYAPLAHKLGLYIVKSELEDLSLKYTEAEAYYGIKQSLNATKSTRDAYVERFIAPIRKMLDDEGLKYQMKGRTKSIHSIWQKMKKQGCGFEGVYDLFAIRIILDSPLRKEKEHCWKVFSLITNQYESNLKRLRDWLTVPKSNGYESLHVTVRGPEDKWVEVQIRTARMDDIAEHGLAAHWRYKGVRQSGASTDLWLENVRTALYEGDDALLDKHSDADNSEKDVYVFTPKGDLFHLSPGATVLDFAYHIHTAVGNRCVGGKINGTNVQMRQKLQSGDVVEILTSTRQVPKEEWLSIVKSSHARSKIKQAIKEIGAHDGILARELLERKLKNRKIEWNETTINILVKKMGFKEANEFYRAIANEKLDVNDVIEQYELIFKRENNLLQKAEARSAEEFNFAREQEKIAPLESDVLIIDRNLKGIDFQMARCCNPVYGDDVFGFVTSGGGFKIHRCNCPNAPALRERFAYRIIKARWAGKGGGKYPITLHVVGQDDLGIVNNITSIISKEEKIQLRSISIDSNDGLFYGVLTVMVDDTAGLSSLIKKIQTVKGVKAVSRN